MYKTVRLSTLVESLRRDAVPGAKNRLSERTARLAAVHAQVEKMRQRFANVTQDIDDDGGDDEVTQTAADIGEGKDAEMAENSESDQLGALPSPKRAASTSGKKSTKGTSVWSRLRSTIVTTTPLESPGPANESKKTVAEPKSILDESEELMRYWTEPHRPAPLPAAPPSLTGSVRDAPTTAISGDATASAVMAHATQDTAGSLGALTSTAAYADAFPIESLEMTSFPTMDSTILVDMIEAEASVFNEFDCEKIEISKITDIIHAKQTEIVSKEFEDEFDKLKAEEVNLVWREDKARQRVLDLEERAKSRFNLEQKKLASKQIEAEQQISKEFKRARESLEIALRRQFAYVKEVFGNLTSIDSRSIYNRYLAVQSVLSPQPVELRIHQLKAVKSKLPQGTYCAMVSLYDGLGGSPLAWSSRHEIYGIDSEHLAITRPVHHAGRYFDHTVKFEDSVFALCPPKAQIKPSYIFLLEVYQLRDYANSHDKVVGWGAIPICDEFFDVVEGKYRLPLLRGFPDPFAQHFHGMEQDSATDLSTWLCNVYLEIKCLEQPLQSFVRKESHSSGIVELDYIRRSIGTKAYSQGSSKAASSPTFPPPGAGAGVDYDLVEEGLFRRRTKPAPRRSIGRGGMVDGMSRDYDEVDDGDDGDDDDDDDRKGESSPTLITMLKQATRMMSSKALGAPSSANNGAFLKEKSLSNLEKMVTLKSKPTMASLASSRALSKRLVVPANAADDGADAVGSVYERGFNHDVESDLHPQQSGKLGAFDTYDNNNFGTAALEGTVIRKYTFDGPRLDTDAVGDSLTGGKSAKGTVAAPVRLLHSSSTSTSLDAATRKEWPHLTNEQEDLEQYSMALAGDVSRKRQLLPSMISRNKMRFIMFEIWGDLSFHKLGTLDFFITVVVFAFSTWFRIWIHYLCQYGALLVLGVPTFDFELKVLLIFFKHIYTSLSTANEVFVVVAGSLSNIIVFSVMAGLCFLGLKYAWLPEGVSKFMVTYGFNVVLDPVLILIIDLCYANFNCKSRYSACSTDYSGSACTCMEAEFMLLYQRTYHDEGSGLSGILITCILYLGAMVLSSLIFYFYVVYIHKKGRVLDVWRRMTGNEEEFFVPHDFEISFAELSSICRRAQKWSNNEGNIRTVTVSRNSVHSSKLSEKDISALSKKGSSSRNLDEFAISSAYYAIYELAMDGSRSLYRHFLRNQDGTILEIFDHNFVFNGQDDDGSDAFQAIDAMEKQLESVTDAYKTRAQQKYIVFTNLNKKM